jgi:hypothetical protein
VAVGTGAAVDVSVGSGAGVSVACGATVAVEGTGEATGVLQAANENNRLKVMTNRFKVVFKAFLLSLSLRLKSARK